MGRLRLYAIVHARKSLVLPPGLGGERLQVIRYRGLSLVVGAAHAPVEPTRANLITHDRIVTTIAESSLAILPARFGVVAESAQALKAEIADRENVLNRALELVAGRVQMILRVPAGARRPARSAPGTRSPGKKYLESRAAALAASSPFPPPLRKQLAAIVKAERIDPAPPGGLVIYHLIDSHAVGAYQKLVRKGASGPFPPYAFVPGHVTP